MRDDDEVLTPDTVLHVGDEVEQRLRYTLAPNEMTQELSVRWLRKRLRNSPTNEVWVRLKTADPEQEKRQRIRAEIAFIRDTVVDEDREDLIEEIIEALLPYVKEVE